MLFGRERECARIADLVAAAQTGSSGALVLRGEAGIGKSALLSYATELAGGLLVLRGTGIETESELPFAGAHRLLRPLQPLVAGLPDAQRDAMRSALGLDAHGAAARPDRWLLSLAVLSLLAEAASTQPVLCIVDDAQWLDRASVDALTFVARRIEAEGIAMLFAVRDDPGRDVDTAGLAELRLTGLDAAAADALLAGRAGTAIHAEVRERVLAGTLGNPLALSELAAALSVGQLDGSAPLPDRLPVGADVEQLFGAQVHAQPVDTKTVLLVAAIDDSDDLDVVLRALRGLGVEPAALDAAERAGLVSIDSSTVRFRHPQVRSAVYRGATSTARRAVERAVADALDGAGHRDRRAWHLAKAAIGSDDTVAEELTSVAVRAADRGGYNAAAAGYARAAELTADADARAELRGDAAEAAWLAGQPDTARTLIEQAAPAVSQTSLRARLAHLRGAIEAACGAPAAAYATLLEGSELAAKEDPERAVAMLVQAGQIAWGTGDLPRILDAGNRLAGLPTGDASGARTVIGLARFLAGDTAAAAREMAAAVALAKDSREPQTVMLAAAGAMFLGADTTAIDLFTRAVARTRAAGAAATLPVLLAPLSTIELFTGRYGSAATTAAEALRLASATAQENPAAHARSVQAWLAAVRGDGAECVALAEAAIAHAVGQRLGPHAAIAAWALAHHELASGRPERAHARLTALAAAAPGEGHPMVSLFATADLVESAVRVDDAATAEGALLRLDTWAGNTGVAWTKALVARCRGQLAPDDDCDRHFDEALHLHAHGGRPFDTARTSLAYGARLRRRRRRADARTHLRAALEAFERLGATPWAEQARTELNATGETARKRDVSTLTQLTPQELQIARLVADGATNKTIAAQLFLSPRTVDYHLRKVFAKLGLASRQELVRMAWHDDAIRAR